LYNPIQNEIIPINKVSQEAPTKADDGALVCVVINVQVFYHKND
jgi:hypothetical protein